MKLESFRENEIGRTFFGLNDRNGNIDPTRKVLASYSLSSIMAFYSSMQDIEELEMAKGTLIPNGRNAITSISLWFLSLESFINTLLKLTCLKLGLDFENESPAKLSKRFTFLIKLLALDDIRIKRTGIYQRLNEFIQFRNEIFHDRNIGKSIQFKKTFFSSVPILCNQIDVLQALLIFLEVTNILRFSVEGLDAMPDIFIHVNNKAFHKKLDYLYLNLIKPSFKEILNKHNLTTDLDLDQHMPVSEKSAVFRLGEVCAFNFVDSPSEFKFELNKAPTHITSSYLLQITENEQVGPDQFRMPNYTKKNRYIFRKTQQKTIM
jgi:hypothetical protein